MEVLNVEEGIEQQAISQSPGSDTVSDTQTYPAETQNFSKTLVNLAKLGLTVWMIVDQAFDGFQSYKYWIYSIFWSKEEWYQEQLGPCNETRLKECFAYLHGTTLNTQSLAIQTDCGTYFKVSQNQTLEDFFYGTIVLNCKLRLHEAYFACSLAIWLLPPAAYGTILTVAKYKVV